MSSEKSAQAMRMACAFICVSVLITATSAAHACSICECGDPLASAGEAGLVAGQARFALDTEVLTARARSDDDPEFVERVTQYTVRPTFAFSPIALLTFVARIPIVRKDWSATAEGESAITANPTGIGDVELGARLFLYNQMHLAERSHETFAISVGSSLPTGANNAQENGQRIDEHAQLGTGAPGPYAGLLYGFRRDPWNFFASVTGRERLRNSYGYKYGAALLWSLRNDYRLLGWLSLGLSLDGRYAARDDLSGVLQNNTGGLVLAVVPSLKVRLYEELWLYGSIQVPAVTHLFGDQHVGPTALAGIQYTFQ
jgi:hypothetical protein